MLRVTGVVVLAMLLAIGLAAQWVPSSQPTVWATKPDAAAFEKIVNDRLAEGQESIDQIVAVKGGRTIDNTLVPYDEAIRQINIGNYLANMMFQVHPDAAFRDKASAMTQKATAVLTALTLNRDVYKALAALDLSKTDATTRYYVTRTLL